MEKAWVSAQSLFHLKKVLQQKLSVNMTQDVKHSCYIGEAVKVTHLMKMTIEQPSAKVVN